jgi:hypothetical protein
MPRRKGSKERVKPIRISKYKRSPVSTFGTSRKYCIEAAYTLHDHHWGNALMLSALRLRSRQEEELWDALLVRKSELYRAKDAYELLSGSPELQERARSEFAESRSRYLVALEAFAAYVYSSIPSRRDV